MITVDELLMIIIYSVIIIAGIILIYVYIKQHRGKRGK